MNNVNQGAADSSASLLFFVKCLKRTWRTTFLTAMAIIFYYHDYRIIFLLCLVGMMTDVVGLLVILVASFKNNQNRKKFVNLARLLYAIGLPALLLLNIRSIDFACTSAIVWIAEPILLKEVRRNPIATFAYHRFNFGDFAANGRTVIFDESDQVLLPPQQRSKDWWITTNEDQEIDRECFSAARPMFSHFYLRYFSCI